MDGKVGLGRKQGLSAIGLSGETAGWGTAGGPGLEIEGFADGDDLAGRVGDEVQIDLAADDDGGVGAQDPIEMPPAGSRFVAE